MIYICAFPERYVGQPAVDTGQCARLVQVATGAPQTTFWRKGQKVRGNSNIARGTAIATFELGTDWEEARSCGPFAYTNRTDHTAHAALYINQDESGITVVDQWSGQAPIQRKIPFTPSKVPIGSGENYYIVEGPPYFNMEVSPDRSQAA